VKLRRILVPVIAASICLCNSVFANSIEFSNTDSSNWDKPSNGKLEVTKFENKFLFTNAAIQWSDDQLKELHGQDIRNLFPALIFRADRSNQLHPKIMISNLPGAKFNRKLNNESDGETIKVSSFDASGLAANKAYTFFTAWGNTALSASDDPYVTLTSLQRFGQRGGSINDLPNTYDFLSSVHWSEVKVSDNQPKLNDVPSPSNPNAYENLNKTINSNYFNILSKKELEAYKMDKKRQLKSVPDSKYGQFVVTFDKPVGIEDLDKLLKDYKLTITQYYAAAASNLGEEFTVSWFDSDQKVLNLLDRGYSSFGITELQGTASAKDLKRLNDDSNVDLIEIEEGGILPTGVHWLNTKYADEQ
jgi:hypothetical protein